MGERIWELTKPYKVAVTHAIEMVVRPLESAFVLRDNPCFLFDDGTTQGWIINQLYDTVTQTKLTTKYPYGPFVLMNYKNIGLEAAIMPINDLISLSDHKTNGQSKKCDIYLESPILLNFSSWQNIKGFNFDLINKIYTTICGQAFCFAQLQVKTIDSTGKERLFVESDPVTNTEITHQIWNLQTYQISWTFNFPAKVNIKNIKQIRIKLTTLIPPLNYYQICQPQGSYILSKICTIT